MSLLDRANQPPSSSMEVVSLQKILSPKPGLQPLNRLDLSIVQQLRMWWAGQIAQMVQCTLSKHEDLNSDRWAGFQHWYRTLYSRDYWKWIVHPTWPVCLLCREVGRLPALTDVAHSTQMPSFTCSFLPPMHCALCNVRSSWYLCFISNIKDCHSMLLLSQSVLFC